ncbi:MAG: carboxylate-amine ligase [Proteobacteria bacterium]|nr:carboxylate-amine ligase [Pseudomonadota bacterium]
MSEQWSDPGSPEELAAFAILQKRVPILYRLLTNDPRTPQTVVVVPSLSMDPRELVKISGAYHYEERMLVNLMLLRQPRTRMIFVTSQQLDPTVIDYYLALLPGLPTSNAKRRLVMLHCNDGSNICLTQKILARPRLMERIKSEIHDFQRAHLVCFNSTRWERTLAVRLGLPLNSTDPELKYLGTKSGCREAMRAAGARVPYGFERLTSRDEVAEGLAAIKKHNPKARRGVVKLNEGFSGEGNAVIHFEEKGAQRESKLKQEIYDRLPTDLKFEAPAENWDSFITKLEETEGVVEEFIEGSKKESPSAQCRVNAIHQPQVISTHDQVLGGPSGQVFIGCTFPAKETYRLEIQESGLMVSTELARRGVIGRFGIDYVSVPDEKGGWKHYAIEINLRKGGTTHPFLTLKFLTSGNYSMEDGLFYAPSGKPKYYFATDTLQSDDYVGLRPDDLMDIAVYHGLHFHGPSERGVVFHLIGAMSEFGKIGLVCIGDNLRQAYFLYKQTLQVLAEETGREAHL